MSQRPAVEVAAGIAQLGIDKFWKIFPDLNWGVGFQQTAKFRYTYTESDAKRKVEAARLGGRRSARQSITPGLASSASIPF